MHHKFSTILAEKSEHWKAGGSGQRGTVDGWKETLRVCGELAKSEPAPSYIPDQREDVTPWARLASSMQQTHKCNTLEETTGKKKKKPTKNSSEITDLKWKLSALRRGRSDLAAVTAICDTSSQVWGNGKYILFLAAGQVHIFLHQNQNRLQLKFFTSPPSALYNPQSVGTGHNLSRLDWSTWCTRNQVHQRILTSTPKGNLKIYLACTGLFSKDT